MKPNLLRRLITRRDEGGPDPHTGGSMSVVDARPPRPAGDQRHRRNHGDEIVGNPPDARTGIDNGIAYFTRDRQLFELIAEDWRLNAGLGPTIIREAAFRDVATEEIRFVTGESIAGYQPVATTTA